jgi:putative transposase
MIDNASPQLSVREQCVALRVPRATLYYKPTSETDDSFFANMIHDLWIQKPYYGYRRITKQLHRDSYTINHKRVYRIMKEARIQALYPRPRTSMSDKAHKKYPYLLRDVLVSRPNQVWATDITYVQTVGGWMYLVAVIDVHSRYLLAWRLSSTLEATFCLDMLEYALLKAKPDILNTDQGCQFTSEQWTQYVESKGIQISMDGVGRWADNIYIERFWRTLKHEHLFWQVFSSVVELKKSIDVFIRIYNTERLHQALNYHTPSEVYAGHVQVIPACHKKKDKLAGAAPQFPPRGDVLAAARGLEQSPCEPKKLP